MRKKLNQLVLVVFIGGLAWTTVSDWAITYWGQGKPEWQVELLRAVNDVGWFGLTLLILYRQIRQQQQSLYASEIQYRTLFAANPTPMWIYDQQTLRFVMVNQASIEKYGYSQAEFEKLSIFDIRPPAEHQRLRRLIDQRGQTMRQAGIWRHIKADGSEIIVSVTSHPLTFDGKACKMVMVTDVTELMEKKARLRALNKTLLQIAWSHSHELRKPLCSIMAMLPLLQDQQTDPEHQQLLGMLATCALELDDSLRRNTEAITSLGNQSE